MHRSIYSKLWLTYTTCLPLLQSTDTPLLQERSPYPTYIKMVMAYTLASQRHVTVPLGFVQVFLF